MTPREINKAQRYYLFGGMSNWIAKKSEFTINDKKAVVEEIKKRFKNNDTSYGFASEKDFGDLAIVFSNLFAHNNKQYFVYKAISDSNKVGYLSRRQYYILTLNMAKWNKTLSSHAREREYVAFLARHGNMASPYKLLKRAFKENPRTKFLARFFPLKEDKKTTQDEEILIDLCDSLMRSKTNIEILPASINECYQVKLTDDYSGSGERYTTSSCMYNYPVGKFYEAFGVEARIVYERGKPIGRFLLWNLPDGKQYVDRLYVQGHGYQDALAEIDKQFEGAYKYPFLRDNENYDYLIELKNPELLLGLPPRTPYIDTFGYLQRKDDKYFLSNHSCISGYTRVDEIRNASTNKRFCCCEHCKQLYWTGDQAMDANNKNHILVCSAYEPKQKKLKDIIRIYRKYVKGGFDNELGTALFQV